MVDMSPAAVTERLHLMGELWELSFDRVDATAIVRFGGVATHASLRSHAEEPFLCYRRNLSGGVLQHGDRCGWHDDFVLAKICPCREK